MARFKRTAPPRPPSGPPASTKDGAAAVIAAAVKLFDRQDGEGVDRRLLAEILFTAAFDVLDRLPNDQRQPLARRVHAGSYERTSGNHGSDFAPSKTGPGDGVSAPSNTAGFKSSGPGPENLP
jgi:hypothetical protein